MHDNELFDELLSEIYSKGKEYKEKKIQEKELFYEKVNNANELLAEIHNEYHSNIEKLLEAAKDNKLSIRKEIYELVLYDEYFVASLSLDDATICFSENSDKYRGVRFVKSNGTYVDSSDTYYTGITKIIENIGFGYMIEGFKRIPGNLPYYLNFLDFFLEHGKEFAAKLIAINTIDLLKQSEEKISRVNIWLIL